MKKTECFPWSGKLAPWQTILIHHICGKMLYLPQMAPFDVWREIPGAKSVAPNCRCRTTYLLVVYDVDTSCVAPPLVWQEGCRKSVVGNFVWKMGLGKAESRDVKQKLIPYVGQLAFAKVPIEGWITDPDVMYMASVMVLVVLCTSLIWWPMVFAWS